MCSSDLDQRDVLEEVIEPYLLQQGFLQRTPRGRMLTEIAYRHLDLAVPAGLPGQLDLLRLEPDAERCAAITLRTSRDPA